ncbi:30S ribosomal protein S4 [candidate division Kazan bacterium RIFCSPHIGHO2_01_FULL_44_14]|uniref:Small ribosomal subunit protein uS4 n=1 Tax=candidate division Kazan bacterium RIFCSPLOWO2_01_FULL_45_19 TaxID=1798538 RepID=A0A1F4NR78_UNCK3|nr:hypothetical protein [uncultured bacterium]OGB73392.1 MAG: 30S ribosomal protein S4 [candidate division Kazan bacterium RIFCSPLOWO2_01_FULL_45_19]OGB77637.1 MAG: 30S ribosomal protein S4 [candidate division Kazan bacterium RIFCSPHIGHO2_01_FULL_44_14]
MGRYTGPTMKKVRGLGEEFAMSGDRAAAAKYVKLHRKQPPGIHGKKRAFVRLTGYGQQLKEKQKARVFYHLTAKQLKKYYTAGKRQTSSTDIAMLIGVETRLDNVIYRAGLVDSHPAARQLVSHGHFSLNGRKVDVPSIQVRPGDVITLSITKPAIKTKLEETIKANKPVSWLKVDSSKFSIEVISLPIRDEIEVPFNEKLIIEFYSR